MAAEKSLSWGVKVLILAISVAVGFFVSRVFEERPTQPEPEPESVAGAETHAPPPAEADAHPPPQPYVEEMPKSGLEEVDYALGSEDYEGALKIGREKQAAAAKELLPRFRYREALALEATGHHASAAALYHEVAGALKNRAAWLRVRLREATCLARSEKAAEARTIFAELHELASQDEHPDAVFFQDLYVAAAVAEAPGLVPLSSPTCDDLKRLSVPAPVFPVKRWVAWADEPEENGLSEESDMALPPFPARDAVQALRDAMAVAPNHPQTPYAHLVLACHQARSGQRLTAVQELSRLLKRHPHDEVAVHAVYDRGLLELQQSEFRSAKESFLEVVDRTLRPDWKALGWWWLGRSRMDSGNVDEAVAPLEEAIHYGKGTPVERYAVLALAATYLEKGEARKAHRQLDPFRRALREHPYRPFASFLDARARLSIALGQGRTAVGAERDDLLEAILQFPSETPVGPLLNWLVGDSAIEMGLGSLARPRFEAASKDLRGALAVRMLYRVAEEDARMGRTKAAKVSFAAASIDPGEWGTRSRLQLGEIALREEQPVEALRRGIEVYQQSPASRDAALVLMGKAYLLLGDANRAATCFGGDLPTE